MATIKELLSKAKAKAIADRLMYLMVRWEDEKEYEDFGEYVNSIAQVLPSAATRVELTKKFRLSFDLQGIRIYFMSSRGSIVCGQEMS